MERTPTHPKSKRIADKLGQADDIDRSPGEARACGPTCEQMWRGATYGGRAEENEMEP